MKKLKLKRSMHLKINKKSLLLLLGIISSPIIVFIAYFFAVGSFLGAIFLTIMEFALISFTICINRFLLTKNKKKLQKETQENSGGKLATILTKLEEIIHQNYPFKEIKVRYMKPSFYEYLASRNYKKARDQILHKFKIEEQTINDIRVKLFSINRFLSSKDELITPLDKNYKKKVPYNIPIEVLKEGFRREHPNYLRSLKNELKKQIHDLDFIAKNVVGILSQSGMILFLTKEQSQRANRLSSHFKRYRNYKIEEALNLKLKNIDSLDLEKIQLTLQTLFNLIDSIKLKEIDEFLNEIQVYIETVRNDLTNTSKKVESS